MRLAWADQRPATSDLPNQIGVRTVNTRGTIAQRNGSYVQFDASTATICATWSAYVDLALRRERVVRLPVAGSHGRFGWMEVIGMEDGHARYRQFSIAVLWRPESSSVRASWRNDSVARFVAECCDVGGRWQRANASLGSKVGDDGLAMGWTESSRYIRSQTQRTERDSWPLSNDRDSDAWDALYRVVTPACTA